MSDEATARETRGFETEVKQLLGLMVHSLYSNKEIFLRELVSNASDAIDKLRFEALTDADLFEGEGDLQVEIAVDRDARTVTVRDNGIGMSREEIIENLGTIARSGTRQFFESLTGDQASDAQLIGQFGVGFYSSFIVADRVTVTSRRAGAPPAQGVSWESTGDGTFTVETRDVAARGTEVVLHLQEDQDDFLDDYRIKSVLRKYSDHITVPIMMPAPPAPAGDEDESEAEDGEVGTADGDVGGTDGAPALERVNSATALWARARNEITAEEYDEFYKHIAHDFEAPLVHTHNRVEGNLEYTTLFFIPARAPFDLWDRNVRRGVKLYVRRVFIMDDAEQLMPTYLRFVRGVVDCADLPLNVSREILQQNRQIESIRAGSVKRVLDLLGNLARNEQEKYATFWGEFGRVIKEGVIEDHKNRDDVAKLLRFASTHGDGDAQTVSLDDYLGRMEDDQKAVYFITASSFATASNSPHLEVFRDKGIEVLLLIDEIDEWVIHHLTEYEGKPLRSVAKGALDLDQSDEDGKSGDESDAGADELMGKLKAHLEDRVKDVRTTRRLTSSPACLVADDHEMGAHLERLLQAAGQTVPGSRPILEVNPAHPVVRRIAGETDTDRQREWAGILFDQALLSEGGQLDDPAGFVRRLNEMFVALDGGASPAAPGGDDAASA